MPTEFAAEGDEGDGGDVLMTELVLPMPGPAFEHLAFFAAGGEDEVSALGKLFEEDLRGLRGGGGDEDAVIRPVREQAAGTVPGHHDEVFVAEFVEGVGGLSGEGVVAFDGVDLPGEFAQDSGLIAGAGADFEEDFMPFQFEELGHQGDDVGLGDGLVFGDGEGAVFVGFVPEGFGDEAVARDVGHGLEDARVGDAAGDELVGDHEVAGGGGGVFGHGGNGTQIFLI